MSRFARLVHFGAIKMDIGLGIHLNELGEVTCRRSETRTDVPFEEEKRLLRKQPHIIQKNEQ
jgi:hypothetical protein